MGNKTSLNARYSLTPAMVSERLKAFKSFKNLKNPRREFLDQESKAKKQSGFEKKKHEIAVPIFSRKSDAFFGAGRKNHTPQKKGCDWKLPSCKKCSSVDRSFAGIANSALDLVLHHKSFKTQHPPRRWFRWAVQAHLFGFSSASYRLTPTTLAFAHQSLTFFFARNWLKRYWPNLPHCQIHLCPIRDRFWWIRLKVNLPKSTTAVLPTLLHQILPSRTRLSPVL